MPNQFAVDLTRNPYKPVSPRLHGFFDYLVGASFFVLPPLMQIASAAAATSYILGGLYILFCLASDYQRTFLRKIQLKTHASIELVFIAALFIAPWAFGFSHLGTERNYFIVIGFIMLSLWLMTDFKALGETVKIRRHG